MSKVRLLFWLAVFAFAFPLQAQDTLITVHGDILSVKLLEINASALVFQTSDSGQTSTLPFSEVFIIKYKNGDKDVYPAHLPSAEKENKPEIPTLFLTPEQFRHYGTTDAAYYYNPRGIGIAVGLVSFLIPPIGLVVALSVNPATPPDGRLTSDPRLLTETEYLLAYHKEAKRKRRNAALRGFGVGFGSYLILLGYAASN